MTPARRLLVRRLLSAAVVLLVLVAAIGWYAWRHRSPAPPPSPAMASARVVSTAPAGPGRLSVTAAYDARGPRRVTTDVDAATYARDGRVVWVCFDPDRPDDVHRAYVRLPSDPLCGQRKL